MPIIIIIFFFFERERKPIVETWFGSLAQRLVDSGPKRPKTINFVENGLEKLGFDESNEYQSRFRWQ